jgi:hypothetical protein
MTTAMAVVVVAVVMVAAANKRAMHVGPVLFGISLMSATVCASCSSTSSGSNDGPVPNGSFSVNAGSIGNASCPGQTQALVVTEAGTLSIACTSGSSADAENPHALNLPSYHGTDTYSFTTTDADGGTGGGGDQPFFYATVGGVHVGNTPASGASPATTCTITLTGSASLSKGSEVKGHVHCDDMATSPPEDPSGPYVSPVYGVSVDADFDAFDPLSI